MNKYCLAFILCLSFFVGSKALADTTAPVTQASLFPASPDGENGWYISPVGVNLNASDLESGIKEINWKIGNSNWQKKTFTQTLNMLINPSFEQSTEGWAVTTAPGSVGERTSLQSKEGNYSIKTTSSISGVSYWSNNQSYVVVAPWKTISLGAWMKGNNVIGNGVYMNIYVKTSAGDLLLYTSSGRSGTFDWVYEGRDLIIASDSAYGLYFELVLDGTGESYYDGVYAAYASDSPEVNFNVSTNGVTNLRYYSVDFSDNLEQEKLASFKIDSVSPTNWQDFETERAGNEHTLISRITVLDNASGLSSANPEFQYSVLNTFLWGYFSDYGSCRGDFNWNEWLNLGINYNDGDLIGMLDTPAIDYCNSNWLLCKGLRFKVSDMAGNESTKEICINGPWVSVVDGDVMSLSSIDMTSAGPEDNSNAAVVSSGSLSNFSSSLGWEIYDYVNNIDTSHYSYAYLKGKFSPSSSTSSLPIIDGIYETPGTFYINSSTIPGNYSQKDFKNVLFVNGNLVIRESYSMLNSSGTIFVVKGNVLVDKSVKNIAGFFVVDNKFDSSYNGGLTSDNLVIYGGIKAKNFELSKSLLAFKNSTTPSEKIIYDPKYLVDFSGIFGTLSVRWVDMD